jgi:hypothetical protein
MNPTRAIHQAGQSLWLDRLTPAIAAANGAPR